MGNIQVEFRRSRQTVAAITTLIMFVGVTFFCFGNGQMVIGSLVPMVLENNMLLGGLVFVELPSTNQPALPEMISEDLRHSSDQ